MLRYDLFGVSFRMAHHLGQLVRCEGALLGRRRDRELRLLAQHRVQIKTGNLFHCLGVSEAQEPEGQKSRAGVKIFALQILQE